MQEQPFSYYNDTSFAELTKLATLAHYEKVLADIRAEQAIEAEQIAAQAITKAQIKHTESPANGEQKTSGK